MSHLQGVVAPASAVCPTAPASPTAQAAPLSAPHRPAMAPAAAPAAQPRRILKPSAARQRRARGISLIEILVTLVVIAFGVLGLGGLMVTGVKANHGAYVRTQAVNLAYDIADRMRANRAEALNGVYAIGLDTDVPEGSTAANQDLIAWRGALQRALPAGTGGIERIDVGTGTVLEITIRWDNSRTPNETALETFVTRTDI